MNIEQLVKRGKTKDKYAINDIMKKFTPLILKTANSIYINGYDRDDLIQIGYISIIKAIGNYDANKNSNFTAYVSVAIRKNYYYEIRKKSKQNYEISYDAILQNGTHLDLLNGGQKYNIEEHIIQKEKHFKLKIALSKLSNDEREFLFYLLENGHGALREYSKIKNIKYETLKKRKKRILEKLKKFILDQVT
jgi:RNA polymerase sigma factor (sigma-70 family)